MTKKEQDVAITAVIEIMEQMTEQDRLTVFDIVSDFSSCSDASKTNISRYANGLSILDRK